MKLLKRIPFFLFLLVVFFCLHGSVENYGYLNLKEVLEIGTVILMCISLFFCIIFLFTKSYIKASLITFFISSWYLFFGVLHDWIKSKSFLSFISSYTVLLPFLVIITVLFALFIFQNKVIAIKLHLYLNLLLIIYCLIDSVMLANKFFATSEIISNTVVFDNNKVNVKPNVYFLLFDEYPGYKSLKDSFAFANDNLYSFLTKNQFYILPVYANYDFTVFSMSSILNMRYVDSGYNAFNVGQRDLQIRINEIRNGEVFRIFKNMGYQIFNYSIFDIGKSHGVSSKNAFLPVHSILLTDKILHNRIIRTSSWLFATGKFTIPWWKKKYLYQNDTNNQYAQKKLLDSANKKSTNPRFYYAHFMLPHWPFYRDSTGGFNHQINIANSHLLSDKSLFLTNVKYTNSVIKNLINSLIANDSSAVIVVMSDHGFRSYKNIELYEPMNFDNICAVRLPGYKLDNFKDSWSNVNFFRYLFNSVYGQQIPYLKDSTILLKYDKINR